MTHTFMRRAYSLYSAIWQDSEGMVNRHHFFSTQDNCPYADKAAARFEKEEYPAVRAAFLDLLAEFRKIEGEDWGSPRQQ